MPPDRPATVPADASWNAAESRWQIGAFENRMKFGEWRTWTESGVLLAVENFAEGGYLKGRFEYFFEDGTPKSDGFHDPQHTWGEGQHRRFRDPAWPKAWKPFGEALGPKVVRAEAWFTIMGGFVDRKCFDADGELVSARGKILDPAKAKAKKKAAGTAQERLAALAGITLPDFEDD